MIFATNMVQDATAAFMPLQGPRYNVKFDVASPEGASVGAGFRPLRAVGPMGAKLECWAPIEEPSNTAETEKPKKSGENGDHVAMLETALASARDEGECAAHT